MGKRDLAIKDLDRAVEGALLLREPLARAYATRAAALESINDDVRALSDWRKALEKLTSNEIAENMLRSAAGFFERAQYKRTIEYCDEITKLEPGGALMNTIRVAYLLRAEAHAAIGKLDESIIDYTRSLRLDPGDDAAYFIRGRAYVAKSDYASALADFSKAIALRPTEPAYRIARARVLQLAGKADAANEDLLEASRLRGGDGQRR
jgi:tetratricopeptide (TPR) repeat protein